MKTVFILAAFFSFLSAHADTISFQVTELDSTPVHGITEVRLSIETNGKMIVALDPNQCGDPGPCTHIEVPTVEVEPKVISDHRNRDGSLLVQLTDSVQLEITSGETVDAKVHTYAKLLESDGSTKNLELKALVNAQVSK